LASLKWVVKPAALASSRPFLARSLKPLSPRPPVSNATHATVFLAAAAVAAVVAAGCEAAPVAPGPVVGAVDAPPPPQAAKMMAAEAPSPSSRLEIANCAPPPKHTHPALHGTPVVPGRIR
jgi:hypothetical protein